MRKRRPFLLVRHDWKGKLCQCRCGAQVSGSRSAPMGYIKVRWDFSELQYITHHHLSTCIFRSEGLHCCLERSPEPNQMADSLGLNTAEWRLPL